MIFSLNKRANNRNVNSAYYWLCVCASGSLQLICEFALLLIKISHIHVILLQQLQALQFPGSCILLVLF